MGLVRDIPHAGEEIKRDAAVCTLVSARATCPSSSNAERACWQRSQTR
jgi:predicted ATP-grasp superfamily ATP-dependent carboligase